MSGTAATARAGAGARTLAAAALAICLGLALAGWIFLALSLSAPVPDAWGFRGFPGIFAVVFGWIGYLLATRRPRNPIGWAFLAAGTLSAIQVAATEYAAYVLFGAGAGLPGGIVGAWLNEWIWVFLVLFATVPVFLYFPDGRLQHARLRGIFLLGIVSAAVASFFFAIWPGPMQTYGVPNPFGVETGLTSAPAGSVGGRGTSSVTSLAMLAYGVAIVGAAVSSIARFRSSRGEIRQQMKWFAAATALTAGALVTGFATEEKWAQVLVITAMTSVPIAIGIAILRYRLYDIDTLINRAIVYGALTAILAGLYSASIGLFQRLFTAITGERSDAAIVITTLILASAFTPVKTWLQTAADRRFKAPADARKRLEAFRESVRLVTESIDGGALRRRFLEEATEALGARGARLVLERAAAREDRAGEPVETVASCDVGCDGVRLGRIELGPRRDGTEYGAAELEELRKTADVVARAYLLAERLAVARSAGG